MSSIEGAAYAWQRRAKHDSLRRGTPQLNIPSLSVRGKELLAQDDEAEPNSPTSPTTRHSLPPKAASTRSRWDGLASRVINHEANAAQEPVTNRRADSFRQGIDAVEDEDNLPTPDEINRENQVNDMNNGYFAPQNFIDNRPGFPWHRSRARSSKHFDKDSEHHRKHDTTSNNKDPSISAASASIHTTEPLLAANPRTFEMNNFSPDNEAETLHAQEDQNGSSRAKTSWRNVIGKSKTAAAFMNPGAADHDTQVIGKFHSFLPLHIMSVPFFAMLTDEHGRRAPPVLFDGLALAITDSELDTNAIRQRYLFRIELRYGEIKWVCKKTLVEFVSLHTALNFNHLRGLNPRPPPFPSQLYYVYQSMLAATDLDEIQRGVRREKVALERRKYLSAYLVQLIKIFKMTVCYDLYEFLEISAMSITKDMGWKGKEGYLENKVNFLQPRLCQGLVIRTWDMEWVMLRDSYIVFADSIGSVEPSDVFLFDKNFHVTRQPGHIVAPYTHHHITIANKQRQIDLKGTSTRIMDDWMDNLKNIRDNSPWVRNHRFDSFSPVRLESKVKWYVDGKDYFYAVSEAILAAKREIYIEDWWLSPELYLRRPPSQYPDFRLDRLLTRKAEAGVMIYIVVYKEMTAALTLNSAYTKTTLQSLHENIIVQRHPDHGLDGGVLFWAHHEKMLIVDNRLAFIGGLDLCYGRYDTHTHQLSDYHHKNGSLNCWSGQDFSNPRIKDFANVQNYDISLIDRSMAGRMPWHDVSMGMVGSPARDVARHFIQRWNFIKTQKSTQRTVVPFLTPKGEYVASRDENRFKGTCKVQVLRSSTMWSSGVQREHSIYNAYVAWILKAEHFIYIENQFFITSTVDDPKSVVKNKIGQALVDRIGRAHREKKKFRVIVVMPLAPAFEGDIAAPEAGTLRLVMHWQYQSISRGGSSIFEKLRALGIEPEDYISFFSLRSYDRINNPNVLDCLNKPVSSASVNVAAGGTGEGSTTADSAIGTIASAVDTSRPMLNANLATKNINEPPSSPADKGKGKLADPIALAAAIFEDSLAGNAMLKPADILASLKAPDVNLRDADKYNYVTEELYIHTKLMIVDDRYVICGSANLNDRSQLGNRDSEVALLVEDQEFIPSRMDGKPYQAAKFAHELRAQLFKEHLGLLPSETHEFSYENEPVKPEDIDSISPNAKDVSVIGVLNNRVPSPATFYRSPDHEATDSDNLVMDPLFDKFYHDLWLRTASNNTKIFRDVFRCTPDDAVSTLEEYRNFVDSKVMPGHVAHPDTRQTDEVHSKLSEVRGHLVEFPTEFLKHENLVGSMLKEAVVPMEIFT